MQLSKGPLTRFAMPGRLMALLLLGCLLTAPAHSDLFSKGKDALGNITGQRQDHQQGTGGSLTNGEIGAGLKEALRTGTDRVVNQLGQQGGFSNDPQIHIPLPGSMKTVQSALDRIGRGGLMDDLEQRLNRAAEVATPKAKDLFLGAISQMTLSDVRNIYNGPDDAATRYFQDKTSKPLADEMQPIVKDSLSQAGAVRAYDKVMGQYESIPLVPDVKANLNGYVVNKGMDGIFHYLAVEEGKIRHNPAQQTTALLKKVFGRH